MYRPLIQIFAMLFACVAIMLVIVATRDGRVLLAAINVALFAVNAWVFVKTCNMREPQ